MEDKRLPVQVGAFNGQSTAAASRAVSPRAVPLRSSVLSVSQLALDIVALDMNQHSTLTASRPEPRNASSELEAERALSKIYQLIADYAYGYSKEWNPEYDESDNFSLRVLEKKEYDTLTPRMKNFAAAAASHLFSVDINSFPISLPTITFLAEHAASSLRSLHIRMSIFVDLFPFLAKLTQLEKLYLDLNACYVLNLKDAEALTKCRKLKLLIFNSEGVDYHPSQELSEQLLKIKTLIALSWNKKSYLRANRFLQTHSTENVQIFDPTHLTWCTVKNNQLVWPTRHLNARSIPVPVLRQQRVTAEVVADDDNLVNPDAITQGAALRQAARDIAQGAALKQAAQDRAIAQEAAMQRAAMDIKLLSNASFFQSLLPECF